MPSVATCGRCGKRAWGHPPQPGDVEPTYDERGNVRHPDCLKGEDMHHRHEGQPGYLGPAAEAQRDREQIAARLASPYRGKAAQAGLGELPLFEPRLI